MAAPVFDATSKGAAVNASSITWNHTTGSGANRVLVVGVLINSSSVTCSGVTWNTSSNLTQVATAINGSARVYLWYLVNPAASTTAAIKVTLSGAAGVVAGAASYTNASQATNPFGTSANATGTSTAPSVTVNSTDATMMIVSVGGDQGSGTFTAGTGVTARWTDASFANGAQGDKAGVATSTTTAWSLSGSDSWVQLAAPLNVAGTQVFKDITVRGRVSAQVFKNVALRGRVSSGTAFHDIVLRGNVGNPAFKSITTRGRISAQGFHDLMLRGRVGAQIFKDITLRGNVGNQVFKAITVRGRVSTQGYHDIALRGRVSTQGYHDIVLRGNIIARNTSGGFTLFANGTGTVQYDSFRVTQYPDPALSLAPVVPRVGSTAAVWNSNVPTNTTLGIDTGFDGVNWTDVSSGNGASLPNINSQPALVSDTFTSNTSANYTNTFKSGGSVATATYDTTNSRITLAGGSGGLYLYTALPCTDVDIFADMDESDAGGLVWRMVDASNYYELGCYDDSSSGGFTNQLRLYKVASGTRSLLGSASTITWPRSTPGTSPYRRIRVTMLGSVITVYFDGTQMQQFTDGSALGSGKCGLRNDGGTSRYYQLRIQPQGDSVTGTPAGDIVTGKFVYTRARLSTSDPAQMPQLLDLRTTARSPQIASGALVPQLHDPTIPFRTLYSDEMRGLINTSGDFYWNVDATGSLTFASRPYAVSPWILYSTDLQFAPTVTPTNQADLYRNRQTILNCTGTTATQTETKVADGTTTSWTMAYPLYSAPTITVGGIVKTVGKQGVDTGKDFYWQPGSNSIGQDTNAPKIPDGYILVFTYVGQFTTSVTVDNTAEQAARAAAEGGTGIVEAVEDGKGMLVSAATTYANGLLTRYGNNNTVQLVASTLRAGLATGQLLTVFLPEHHLNNRELLIIQLDTTGTQQNDGTVLYQYQITATDATNIGSWARVFYS